MKEVGAFFGMKVFVVPDLPDDAFMIVGARRWREGEYQRHVVSQSNGMIIDRWLPEADPLFGRIAP